MEETRETVYEFSAPLLNGSTAGRTVSLNESRGQILLIVNTAGRCGFQAAERLIRALGPGFSPDVNRAKSTRALELIRKLRNL